MLLGINYDSSAQGPSSSPGGQIEGRHGEDLAVCNGPKINKSYGNENRLGIIGFSSVPELHYT